MKYTPTSIAGVTIVDIEPNCDHRGFVSQSFCAQEFAEIGLIADVVQTQISFNYTRGTVRGLHRQAPPHPEAKLVRCTRGAIADVAVDVRPESPTYGRHVMVELTADNHRALFVPPYLAHGFQTLVDDTEVICQIMRMRPPARRGSGSTSRNSASSGRCRSRSSPKRTRPGRSRTASRASTRTSS